MSEESKPPEPGSLLTLVPGRARSRAKAQEDFDECAEQLSRRFKPEFRDLLVPKAVNMYRWRVQLECGCVYELFTRGKDDFPDDQNWNAPRPDRKLPKGEFWCTNDHGQGDEIYRDIVEWLDSEIKEFPPDPEEPPSEDMDPDFWAKVRQPERHSSTFWGVRLSCGHVFEHVVTEVGWKPEDGPKLVSEERAAQMRRDFESYWSSTAEWPTSEAERDHERRMIDQRWPRPEPEQDCRTCRFAQRITGYQRIGWLVPRTNQKKTGMKLDEQQRKKAEARLAKIEAEARQLREKLGGEAGS